MSGRLCFQQTSAFLLGAGKISPSALGFQWRFFIGNILKLNVFFFGKDNCFHTLEDILLQGTLGLLFCPEARLDQWLGKIYTHWYIYVRPGFLVEAKPRQYSKMTTLLIYVKENIFRQKCCVCFRL